MKLPCLGPVEKVSLKEGSPSLMDPNVVIGSKACTCNQCCATGTGTFCPVEPEPEHVKKWEPEPENYVFNFLHLTFFSFPFHNKFDETCQFFPCKKA
jgi:hypothetical protein